MKGARTVDISLQLTLTVLWLLNDHKVTIKISINIRGEWLFVFKLVCNQKLVY